MEKDTTICILNVSRFGSNHDTSANSLDHHVEVSTHESSGVNTVSARFLSILTGKPIGQYLAVENKDECFFKVEWAFPQHKDGPKITTRHLLTSEPTSANLSFSGGLDWAKKLLEHYVISSRGSTTTLSAATIQPRSGSQVVVSRHELEREGDLDNDNDHMSVCSEAPPATTSTTGASPATIASPTFCLHSSVFPSWGQNLRDSPSTSESVDRCGYNDSDTPFSGSGSEQQIRKWTSDDTGDGGSAHSGSAQNHNQADVEITKSLKEQRKQAEAIYARNGDMSEMMALLARAKDIPAAWEPNGRARF